MSTSTATYESFAAAIAARLHAHRQDLSARWLDRLVSRLPVEANDVFPSDALLDHIPLLIDEIAKFIATPEDDIAGNSFVVAKARELGDLRHEQQASVHQLLREYELLRSLLEGFVVEQAQLLQLSPPFFDVADCLRRINQAIAILTQTTVDTFIGRYTETIARQTRQLESFNAMVSHELRQPLNVLVTAAALLPRTEGPDDGERRARTMSAIQRSVARLTELLTKITQMTRVTRLSGSDPTLPGNQRVSVASVAREAARLLQEMARDREVEVVIATDLPEVSIDVGGLELLLMNLLSNAIKYADPGKPRRFVEIAPAQTEGDRAFQVRDNGLGMTPAQLRQLFTPFYRGHPDRDAELGVEGLGLGLTIARDCAQSIGASLTVESSLGEGTTFTVTLPHAAGGMRAAP